MNWKKEQIQKWYSRNSYVPVMDLSPRRMYSMDEEISRIQEWFSIRHSIPRAVNSAQMTSFDRRQKSTSPGQEESTSTTTSSDDDDDDDDDDDSSPCEMIGAYRTRWGEKPLNPPKKALFSGDYVTKLVPTAEIFQKELKRLERREDKGTSCSKLRRSRRNIAKKAKTYCIYY